MKLARQVGPTGRVVGIDCCEAFMEYGRRDVAEAGLDHVSFIKGDALLELFEPEYDFVFSRFGTTFFSNPVAGLKNMRTALKPGGIMTQIVWRPPADNPWLSVAKDWSCGSCRRPARMRAPAGRDRSPWPTRSK